MDLQIDRQGRGDHRGSSGIGLAIAEGLAAEGTCVVIAARGAERIARRFGVKAIGVA